MKSMSRVDIKNTLHGKSVVLIILLSLALFSCPMAEVQAATWHVRQEAFPGGNGTTWHEAFNNIQEAVNMATSWDEIHVKKGTYNITTPIHIERDTKIYGGFNGFIGETLETRNVAKNVTTINGQHLVQHCILVQAQFPENEGAMPTIDGFTIAGGGILDNNAGIGGGIYFDRCWDRIPVVINCTFNDNFAGAHGGAIYNYYSSPRVINCSFGNNRTNTDSGSGGAVYNGHNTAPIFLNCTFSRNKSYSGGAFFNVETIASPNQNGALPTIFNCILWDNTASPFGGNNEIQGPTAGVSYNCINQEGYGDANGDPDGNFNIRKDPILSGSNKFHLRDGSPCIDAGYNGNFDFVEPYAYYEDANIDLDGDPRIMDGTVDMGADEWREGQTQGIWYVDGDVAASGDGSSWDLAYKTIQEGVDAAGSGEKVWVKAGTYTNFPVTVTSGVLLYGGFTGNEANEDQRNLSVYSSSLDAVGIDNSMTLMRIEGIGPVSLDGFTLANADYKAGRDKHSLFFSGFSSTAMIKNCTFSKNQYGIQTSGSEDCSLIIDNCRFSQNRDSAIGINNASLTVTNSSFSQNGGSAIGYNGGTLIVTGCTFTDNTGANYWLGTMYDGGAITVSSLSPDSIIEDCDFSNNSGRNGGAIYANNLAAIQNCTFTGNQANTSGGAIAHVKSTYYSSELSPKLRNCTFTNNTASLSGGGVAYLGGNETPHNTSITNCTFSGNTGRGGGIFNSGTGTGFITNCKFYDNVSYWYTSSQRGGGIHNDGPSITIANSLFVGNSGSDGGGVFTTNADPLVINSTFYGNSVSGSGGAFFRNAGNPAIRNCIMWGNTGSASYPQLYYYRPLDGYITNTSLDDDPLFENTNARIFRLQSASPCINAGSSVHLPADTADLDDDGNISEVIPVDLGNWPRIKGASVDMGAYEYVQLLPGDINLDLTVDLSDAITTMKILTGINPVVELNIYTEVNSDGKIGLEEVLYPLQSVSELRP
jgi:hypothetical protein